MCSINLHREVFLPPWGLNSLPYSIESIKHSYHVDLVAEPSLCAASRPQQVLYDVFARLRLASATLPRYNEALRPPASPHGAVRSLSLAIQVGR